MPGAWSRFQKKKMIQLGLDRTHARPEEFEQKYDMSSADFERRLNASEIEETVEFSDWRMEIGQ